MRRGCRADLGPLEPLGNIDNIHEGHTELLPDRGKGIPDSRRGCPPGDALDDSFAFQLAEAVGEHLCRDASDIELKLGEAALAFAQVPDHMCRPSARKHTHALSERTLGRRWRHLASASLDHQAPYQMVTRFYSQGVEWRIIAQSISSM